MVDEFALPARAPVDWDEQAVRAWHARDTEKREGGAIVKWRWGLGVGLLALLGTILSLASLGEGGATAVVGDLAAFKAALEADGFLVQEGKLTAFDIVKLCCSGALASCLANNAGAPYKVYFLPPAPDQTVPNSVPWAYCLRPDEAIVLVGRTPPTAAYFSYETFLAARYSGVEQVRRRILACIGDTQNHLTIQTMDGADGTSFNAETILITTADRGIDARVRAAATRAGYSQGIVNTDVVPSSVVKLGLAYEADELVTINRIFLPESLEALRAYMEASQVVLRVTPREPAVLDPFPTPVLRVRGTGTTEMDLAPALEALREAILAKYSGLSTTELETSVWLEDSFDGLQRGVEMYAPTRDTIYFWTQPYFKLPAGHDDFVIVYGVNHERTGKATYSNFSLYADPTLKLGVVGENSRVFYGSAREYLPDHPLADYLYVWKISRDCASDPKCLELANCCCERLDLDALPDLWVAFRVYLEKETKVGPAFSEILYDRAIVFRPRE
jgi:hypothetical protein